MPLMIFSLSRTSSSNVAGSLLIDKILTCLPRLNENHQMMFLVHKNQVNILSYLGVLYSGCLKHRTRDIEAQIQNTHSLWGLRFRLGMRPVGSQSRPFIFIPRRRLWCKCRARCALQLFVFGEEPHCQSRFTLIEHKLFTSNLFFFALKVHFSADKKTKLCKKKNQLIFWDNLSSKSLRGQNVFVLFFCN